jgi:large subunit ribosomal protein L4
VAKTQQAQENNASMLKKYNLAGKEIGQVPVKAGLQTAEVSSQLVKDYIVAIRANARQWSANTKGRSEVNHTTKKPHAQKGGGRSRQGSLAAPQYKGGGRVFAPKPKFNQHVRINQKERQQAIRALIAEKIREGRLVVLDSMYMDKPKTKTLNEFFKSVLQGKRVLFLAEGAFHEIDLGDRKERISVHSKDHENMKLSIRNIPRAEFRLVQNVSGYDLILAHDIVITESGMNELNEWLLKDEG